MPKWPYDLPYERLDLRKHPQLYRIGVGEQGVLTVQPYKSELLPHWRFSEPAMARQSSQQLKKCFEKYRDNDDFVGCDMARKFIQMGVTRARRYANRQGGRKYAKQTAAERVSGVKRTVLPKASVEDPIKAESARIFGEVLKEVKADSIYIDMMARHKTLYEHEPMPDVGDLQTYHSAEDDVKDNENEEQGAPGSHIKIESS